MVTAGMMAQAQEAAPKRELPQYVPQRYSKQRQASGLRGSTLPAQAGTNIAQVPPQVVARQVGFSTPVAQEAAPTQFPTVPNPTVPNPTAQNPNTLPSTGPILRSLAQPPADGPSTTATGTVGQVGPLQPTVSNDQAPGTEQVATPLDLSEGYAGAARLSISDVVASVYRSFPMIRAAEAKGRQANGKLVEAWGAYDTKLQAYTLNEPTGFYRNSRHGIGVARQTWWGGYLSAGHRIGRGDFQPWYKERETNEGGEFKLAFAQPLLQGRAIDPQRVAVFQASLAMRTAEPLVQQAILDTAEEAAKVYWKWIASAAVLNAQRRMLDLALVRGEELDADFDAQRRPGVDLVYNRKLIVMRRTGLAEAQRVFFESSQKLSFFLRDESGTPIVPSEDWVPKHFPIIQPFQPGDFAADLANALDRRPEPQLLRLELRMVQLDRQLARNNMQPRVDVIAEASQDTGLPASSKNDKGQFEMLVGIQAEVPLQRRKSQGKNLQALAKIDELSQKLRTTQDKIGIALAVARQTLDLSEQIVRQTEEGLALSIEVLESYQEAYRLRVGKTNLIDINLLETEVNESAIKLIKAQQNWFIALTQMQAALGLNPLDQAMTISLLPESVRAASQ